MECNSHELRHQIILDISLYVLENSLNVNGQKLDNNGGSHSKARFMIRARRVASHAKIDYENKWSSSVNHHGTKRLFRHLSNFRYSQNVSTQLTISVKHGFTLRPSMEKLTSCNPILATSVSGKSSARTYRRPTWIHRPRFTQEQLGFCGKRLGSQSG